jgi:glutamate/tyrosine decarboxylase-like PLP-dependent enzyme
MTRIGQDGYLSAVRRILETGAKMRKGIQEIPDLYVLGDPLWVIAFGSRTLDIYKVLDYMSRKTWSLNGLHKPPCLHICITLRHTQPGVAERFVEDLKSAVEYVKDHPGAKGGMAPVYGMAATLPDRDIVGDLLERYIDLLFEA